MFSSQVEVLDHGDDPGRYTVFHTDGRIWTCNSDGYIICQRRCHSPYNVIYELNKDRNVRLLHWQELNDFIEKLATNPQTRPV